MIVFSFYYNKFDTSFLEYIDVWGLVIVCFLFLSSTGIAHACRRSSDSKRNHFKHGAKSSVLESEKIYIQN